MANKRVDQLTAATTVLNTDLLVVADPSTGAMKKAALTQVASKNIEVNLVDASTVTWNFSLGNIAKVTLAGNRVLSITNPIAMSFGLLIVTQDGVGGRTLSLPGVVPSGYALGTDPSAIDVLGFYYDGVTFFWSVNSSTGGPGIIDLAFPTQVGLSEISGVWSGSNSGTIYANYGLSNNKLASGDNGYIQALHQSDSDAAILAFSTANTNKAYADNPASPSVYNYQAGAFTFSGVMYTLDNSTAASSTGVSISNGDYYRIIRTGSVLKLQKSPDQSVWTDVHTYTFSSSADLFININIDSNTGANKLRNPKGFNLT